MAAHSHYSNSVDCQTGAGKLHLLSGPRQQKIKVLVNIICHQLRNAEELYTQNVLTMKIILYNQTHLQWGHLAFIATFSIPQYAYIENVAMWRGHMS